MDHRERQEADCAAPGIDWGIESFVFSRWDGSPMRPHTVTHAFANVAKKAGLMGIRLHDLRHTYASLMLNANVHPKSSGNCKVRYAHA